MFFKRKNSVRIFALIIACTLVLALVAGAIIPYLV